MFHFDDNDDQNNDVNDDLVLIIMSNIKSYKQTKSTA